jgi:hypothetical protein
MGVTQTLRQLYKSYEILLETLPLATTLSSTPRQINSIVKRAGGKEQRFSLDFEVISNLGFSLKIEFYESVNIQTIV